MVQIQNLNKIINFLRKSLRNRKINSTFALANGKLGYGVMVTLQILVLSFQVRILVAQHEDDFFKSSFFRVVLPGFVQLVAPRQTCLRCWSVGVLLRNHKPCADSLKVNKSPFCLSAQRLQLRCPPPLSICSVCSRLLPPVETNKD